MTIMHTVIVGGGLAGVALASELSQYPDQQIILITKSKLFGGFKKYEDILTAKNTTVIYDTVTGIDPDSKHVLCGDHKYHYGSLVFALGNRPNRPNLINSDEKPLNLITNRQDTRHALIQVKNDLDSQKHVRLNYAIIGGGLSGVELAGDIATMLNNYKGKIKSKPHVTIVEKKHRLLPRHSKTSSRKAEDRLVKLGVKIYKNTRASQVTDGALSLDGTKIPLDKTFWALGLAPNPIYKKYPDIFTLDKFDEPIANSQLEIYRNIYIMSSSTNSVYSIHRKAKFLSRHLALPRAPIYRYVGTKVLAFSIGADWSYIEHFGVYASGKLTKYLLDRHAHKIYKNTELEK